MKKDIFIKYLQDCVGFMSVKTNEEGKDYLDICGIDKGYVKENHLSVGVWFYDTKSVDDYICIMAKKFGK